MTRLPNPMLSKILNIAWGIFNRNEGLLRRMLIKARTLSQILAFKKCVIFAVSTLFFGISGYAQQLDNPLYFNVSFKTNMSMLGTGAFGMTHSSINASFTDEAGVTRSSQADGDYLQGSPNQASGSTVIAKVYANKDYTVNVTSIGNSQGYVRFQALSSQGQIYIFSVHKTDSDTFNGSLTTQPNTYTFTFRFALPNDYPLSSAPSNLRGGESSSLVTDKPIWYVGLGKMRNGKSAGAVGFRRGDFNNANLFTPSGLYYSSPDPAEVDLVAQAGVVRQIYSREVLLDIQSLSSNSYKIDVYQRSSSITRPSGSSLYTVGAAVPFVSYTVSQTNATAMKITRTEDNFTWETSLALNGATWTHRDWHLQGTLSDSYTTTNYTTTTSATVSRTGLNSYTGQQDTPLTNTKNFTSFSWGYELSGTSVGALSTQYTYYTATGTDGSYAQQISATVNADGSWAKYFYGDNSYAAGTFPGAPKRIFRPWLDGGGVTPDTASTTNSAYEDYTYAGGPEWPLSVTKYAPGGSILSKSTWSYDTSGAGSLNGYNLIKITKNDYFSGTGSLTTTSKIFQSLPTTPSFFRELNVSSELSDGRKDSYAYFSGTWDANSKSFSSSSSGQDRLILIFHGQNSAGTQSPAGAQISQWTQNGVTWSIDPLYMVVGRSTISETVVDASGRPVFSGENVYAGSNSIERIAGSLNRYDSHGRLIEKVDVLRSVGSNELKSSYSYNASLLVTETSPDGVVTKYEYDDLLRMYRKTIGDGGSASYPARVQETKFDGANRQVASYSCSCGTAPTRYYYDSSGRLDYKSDPSPSGPDLLTDYAYPALTTTTTTLPSGATQVNEQFLDGRAKSITGSAQPPVYYEYEANSTGLKITRKNGVNKDNGWSEEQYDLMGRLVARAAPAYAWNAGNNSNSILDVAYTYNSKGQLTQQHTTYRGSGAALSPDQLYTYGSAGQLISQGLDLNDDHTLTGSSNDRFVNIDTSLSKDVSGWRSITTSTTYAALNSTTVTQVSQTTTRLSGFNGGAIGSAGLVTGEISSIDATGRSTTQTDSVDWALKRHYSEVSLQGVGNVGFSETINGYSSRTASIVGDKTEITYDSLGRSQFVKSRWNGSAYELTDTYSYYGNTQFVSALTTGGVTTTFAYAWGSPSGSRLVTTTDAAGNTRSTLYNAMDLPWHVGGTGSSPVEYGYDAVGRQTSQTSWRAATYTEGNWPSTTSGDSTTWTLDAATGLATRKTFPDNNHVDYTYTPLGQIAQRTWARNTTATFAYYDGSTTASSDVSHRTQELRSITYNDGVTPAVSYEYNRTGLAASATDITGKRTFGYGSSIPFRLEAENLTSYYGTRVQTPQYDAVSRGSGVLIGNSSNTSADLTQTVVYNASTGLLDHIDTVRPGQPSHTFTYNYRPNTSLVSGYASGNFVAAYTYATDSNRRSMVQGKWAGISLTRFDPVYDTRGYVKSQAISGTAFTDYTAGMSYSSVFNSYGYDALGQVQSAAMYRGTPSGTPAAVDELPGRRFEYRYDAMGNRTSAGATGSTATGDDTFHPSSLNQYDWKENNRVRVIGTAAASASMTANDNTTVSKKDRAYGVTLTPANTVGAAKGTLNIYAALIGAGTGGKDIIGSSPLSWFIPPQHQILNYDADGNLTGDGVWTYTYDGENRLITMTTALPAGQGFTRLKLEFQYDYLNRRVQKKVTNLDTGTLISSRRFLYKGWDLIGEFDAPGGTSCGTLLRSYTWGLDLAGSLSATGCVGALLQIADHVTSKTYFPTYDNNGNISSLVDGADGSLAAVYEYSPFGETLRADGPYAGSNPFRFSTKFTDTESGFVYYGYRYYHPVLGRFINRDPIEEAGDVNLYRFVGNNALSRIDVLGMYDAPDTSWRDHKPLPPDPFTTTIWVNPNGDYSPGGLNYAIDTSHLRAETGRNGNTVVSRQLVDKNGNIYREEILNQLTGQWSTTINALHFVAPSASTPGAETPNSAPNSAGRPLADIQADMDRMWNGRPEIVDQSMVESVYGPEGLIQTRDPWTGKIATLNGVPGISDATGDFAEQIVGGKLIGTAIGSVGRLIGRAKVKPFQVGPYDELSGLSQVGDDLALHHAGQQHAMKQVVPGYNPATAPSIALPTVQHRAIPNLTGAYTGTARDLLARDIRNLWKFTDAPNVSLRELIELNKRMYPGSFAKP